MEESDLTPEEKKQKEGLSSENLTPKISPEEASQVLDDSIKSQTNNNSKNLSEKDSLFRRIIENGFDGITTNPNYKLLALLIILLINLSLFFVVGNIGKDFLRNSGILS